MDVENIEEIEEANKAYYEKNSATSDQGVPYPFHSVDRYKKCEHYQRYRMEWLFHKLHDIVDQNTVILDFACGNGLFTFLMSQCLSPKKIHAFDLSPDLIKVAEQKSRVAGMKDVEYVCASFRALPYPENFFDVIVINDAFHHFPDHATDALEVVRKLLKKGGYLLNIEPINDSSLYDFVKHKILKKKDNLKGHIQFKSDDLTQLLEEKLEIVDSRRFEVVSKLEKIIKKDAIVRALYGIDELFMKLGWFNHMAGCLATIARKT